MPLALSIGHTTQTGKRELNEDFCGAVTPEQGELAARGAVLAMADGVSGSGAGRVASENAVRTLLADYYCTPETWEVHHAIDRVLSAINSWLLAQGRAGRHEGKDGGLATTLSALVLRGNRYYLAHVGDTRIYRLRGNTLRQLTQDHVWDRPEMQHVLKRAVGLDAHLIVDYGDGELERGDRFLLCSDGVWEPLGDRRLKGVLQACENPQDAANTLVAAALNAGGNDNASALVLHVDDIASEGWRDMLDAHVRLPVPPRLAPGQCIDDFEVLELLHESRATLLYKVRALGSGQVQVLKTLQPALAADRQSCEGLLAEEWLAKRLVSPSFPQVVPIPAGSRNRLYYAMTFHSGATLQQQLDRGRHFPAAEIVTMGMQVLKGLGVLQRLAIVHRDIKPANLLQSENGDLRILDMGVALAAGVPYPELRGNPGTPSYMAPELLEGEAASAQSDLYALGVSLYHLLTRKYPYGEIEPFQNPRFGNPVPPTRYRPDIPQWLEKTLLRAVARDRRQRFETPEEMLLALEVGERRPLSAPLATPLAQRLATSRWQAIALISLVLNLLLLYLLLLS